jgi:protein MpaA
MLRRLAKNPARAALERFRAVDPASRADFVHVARTEPSSAWPVLKRWRVLGRHSTRLALLVVAMNSASAATASARAVPLGRSWQGRSITALEVGNRSGTRVLVVGVVHGTETGGLPIARALARLSPPDLDLWIVPDLNPDGVAGAVRQNARGVDLNRNFPWRWRPMSGAYESGARPLSEREAHIAHALILRLHPHVTIWFHQHLDMVWASGGERRIERVFARISGLPYHAMPQLAGSAIAWQNNTLRGTTAFAAELPAGQPDALAVARYVRAVLAAARTP